MTFPRILERRKNQFARLHCEGIGVIGFLCNQPIFPTIDKNLIHQESVEASVNFWIHLEGFFLSHLQQIESSVRILFLVLIYCFLIQRAVLEPALKGQDLIARAKTGTGKTLAFGIPILDRTIKEQEKRIRFSNDKLVFISLSILKIHSLKHFIH